MTISRPVLITDIETVPLEAHRHAPYPRAERTPPSNYKNAKAIESWYAKDAHAWVAARAKECALNPRFGRVLCIGTQLEVHYAETEADEATVLTAWWGQVKDAPKIVTWNGSFDLRFIVVRSLLLRVEPTLPPWHVSEWWRRYSTAEHFDCKMALMNGDVKATGEGLDEWARAFGVPGKPDGITGASVLPMYDAGRHAEIAAYCAADVAATGAIYERLQQFYV